MEQRIIKFRAWDTLNEKMVDEPYRFTPMLEYKKRENGWVGDYLYYDTWQDDRDNDHGPCFIMQFTGLKDKNGKEIYEGDIVQLNKDVTASIIWKDGAFHIDLNQHQGSNHFTQDRAKRFIVIGNIYQNPELIPFTQPA